MNDPGHPVGAETEDAVDELEERVLGHRVDQVREEDPPASDQDVEPGEEPDDGPGSEPTG